MNLFAIFHLDVNVVTNELIYLVLLKVYYVKVLKDDCFVILLLIMLNSLKIWYILVFFLRKHIYYYWLVSFSILKN